MSAPSPIDLLSRVAPVSDQEAAGFFGEDGREGLLDAITRLTPRERPARRRLRRRTLAIAVAAVVVLAAATGAGWALTRAPARDTTSIDCLVNGQTTVIAAASGDPASDCAAVWPSLTGKPAPPLQAYDDGLGGVAVIPSSQKPPAGWAPIASQNASLIELQDSLDDQINGLSSACFDASAATGFAQKQLDRLGFAGWTVKVRPGSLTGQLCYWGFEEPETQTVTLVASSTPGNGYANSLLRQFATSLRPLTQQCLSLPQMKSEVEQRASSLGMSQTATDEHNYRLVATEDDTMRCTTLYDNVGGSQDLILRGPAQAVGGSGS